MEVLVVLVAVVEVVVAVVEEVLAPDMLVMVALMVVALDQIAVLVAEQEQALQSVLFGPAALAHSRLQMLEHHK
jgi:hypothetical protein